MAQQSNENKFKTLITIFFFALLILLFLSWMYLLNIYEVRIKLVDNEGSRYHKIEIVPLNSFGFKALFREVDYEVTIEEGDDNIKEMIREENQILLLLTDEERKVKLSVITEKTQNKTIIELPPKN